ncbi:MAG: AarF/ABC1/UbiB kinase family protein [Chloracidobacterium sp.]|nr:AarF/ABC1/UbiB kinase family protein [Chloracidobacterium sp.]
MNDIAVKERVDLANANGSFVPTNNLEIAKRTSNEELIAEERELLQVEETVESTYFGIRGYLRLFQISRVISMLSLYLYLDQYDLHHKQHLKRQAVRLERARELTRAAYYGEKLYGVKQWFFHVIMLGLRRFFIGNSTNKEANQEKQAVWLKEKLIKLGPTFIKIGQSMGTRADLLPLPFVKELGTLVDQVPPFPNDVAFAIIEHELGKRSTRSMPSLSLNPLLPLR